MTNSIIIPDRYCSLLKDSKSRVGVMGLSIGKQDFYNEEIMHAYASFLQDNFAHALFLIGDLPKKWNIMALEGATENQAIRRARIAGDELRNRLEKMTRNYPLVKVARWSDFKNVEYEYNLSVLRSAYNKDEYFRKAINARTLDFLYLPANRSKWPDEEPPLSLSKEYVLDETAYLLALPLSLRLLLCEIYPGRNTVQEDIQDGKFQFSSSVRLSPTRVFVEAYYDRS